MLEEFEPLERLGSGSILACNLNQAHLENLILFQTTYDPDLLIDN